MPNATLTAPDGTTLTVPYDAGSPPSPADIRDIIDGYEQARHPRMMNGAQHDPNGDPDNVDPYGAPPTSNPTVPPPAASHPTSGGGLMAFLRGAGHTLADVGDTLAADATKGIGDGHIRQGFLRGAQAHHAQEPTPVQKATALGSRAITDAEGWIPGLLETGQKAGAAQHAYLAADLAHLRGDHAHEKQLVKEGDALNDEVHDAVVGGAAYPVDLVRKAGDATAANIVAGVAHAQGQTQEAKAFSTQGGQEWDQLLQEAKSHPGNVAAALLPIGEGLRGVALGRIETGIAAATSAGDTAAAATLTKLHRAVSLTDPATLAKHSAKTLGDVTGNAVRRVAQKGVDAARRHLGLPPSVAAAAEKAPAAHPVEPADMETGDVSAPADLTPDDLTAPGTHTLPAGGKLTVETDAPPIRRARGRQKPTIPNPIAEPTPPAPAPPDVQTPPVAGEAASVPLADALPDTPAVLSTSDTAGGMEPAAPEATGELPQLTASDAPTPAEVARVSEEKQFATDAGVEFTPTTDDLTPPPAKVKARTGMTAEQEIYLSSALTDYAHTDAAHDNTSPPVTIEVPQDGKYTVQGAQQANALHVNLTGKGIVLTHRIGGTEPLPAPLDLQARFKHRPTANVGDGGDPLTAGRRAPSGGVSAPKLTAAQKSETLAKFADDTSASSDAHPESTAATPSAAEADPFADEPSDLAQPMPKEAESVDRDNGKESNLQPHEKATVADNLAKVAEASPEVRALAAQVKEHIDKEHIDSAPAKAPRRRRLPRIDSSAGMMGGKAVSDVLEHAHERIGAIISHVTQAIRDSEIGRATRNGRYRASYEVDKAAGDALNQLVASGEAARTYAHYATRHIEEGLSPAQKSLMVDYLLDERARAIEAEGGTPNRSDLRALSPAERKQVRADPKIQAALMKFRHGPMGTIERLRAFVSPRMQKAQTESGDFLSLLAKTDAKGEAVNGRAPSGKPASGMSGRGQVRGTSHAQQATGTATTYSHDLGEILAHSMTEVLHKANLKQLYKTLLSTKDAAGNPLAYSSALKSGKALPDTITYNGVEYPAVDVSPGYRYVNKAGQVREVRIRVPEPIAHDLEDALTKARPGNDLGAVLHKGAGFATSLSLMTPAELTNHVGRMISVASKIPPVGARLPQRLGELAVPHAGPVAGTLYRMFNTDMSDPANVAVLQRIMDANGGSGRPFSHELGDSILSRVPGLSKVQRFSHDFLFGLPEGKGLAGFDLRFRVMAEKMRAAAEGNTDPQRTREFANQFGQYTSKPEKLVENIRKIAPFAATSLPVKLTEFRLLLGDAGFKNLTSQQRATLRAETLFRGTAGTILGYALINHALSGHWPWQNGAGHETDLQVGKDKNGKAVYVGANRVDPTLSRPLAALGVPDMIADVRHHPKGSLPDALAKDAGRGLYNDVGSSVGSPALQAFATMLSGHDPLYMTRGGQLLQTAEHADVKRGESQAVNNARAAVGGLNPALGAMLGTDTESRERPFESPLWKTVQQMERLTGPVLKQDPMTPQERRREKAHRPRSGQMSALLHMLRG